MPDWTGTYKKKFIISRNAICSWTEAIWTFHLTSLWMEFPCMQFTAGIFFHRDLIQTSPESMTIFPLSLVGSGSVPSCESGTSVCQHQPCAFPEPGCAWPLGASPLCWGSHSTQKGSCHEKNGCVVLFDVNIKQEIQESSFGEDPLTL